MARSADIIAASPDLKRLEDADFEVSIKHGHLLISSVPYVTGEKKVARGVLIFPLNMATDVTVGKPHDHTAYFAGDPPHYADGIPIAGIVHSKEQKKLAEGIVAKLYLSSRPEVADADYEVKVRRYVDVISAPARVIDKTATAQTRAIVESEDDDSPFVFPDSNSARAEITPISDKLKGLKIAIVGLGGTGSYVLDSVAKTPVKEIHLFDDDKFSLHNAYRCPGAPTREQLRARIQKVHYLKEMYARMHKGIISHPERVDETNEANLAGMDFAFLCMDPGPDKARLVKFLVTAEIPFVDTGIGVEAPTDKLAGGVNTITVTKNYKEHLDKVPVKAGGDDELYTSNIQIAELNMLNAAHAVIKWKKHFGFYVEERHEHESTYFIGPNMLTNEHVQA